MPITPRRHRYHPRRGRHTYQYAATDTDVYSDPDTNRDGDCHIYTHTDHDFYSHGDIYPYG